MIDGLINLLTQFGNIFGNIIGQVRILASVPNLFGRIKLRSISWQPFNIEPFAEPSEQSFGSRAMHHPTFNIHDNPSWKMRQQFCHKRLKIIGDNVVLLQGKIQCQMLAFGRNCNCRDGGQSVTAVPAIMNGSLALWSPSSANHWLKHKTAFVRKNNATTGFLRVFLYAANFLGAISQWLSRLFRGLVVRVSGSSNPLPLRFAKLAKDGSKREISFGLPLQYVPTSTSLFCNHEPLGLFSANALVSGVACLRVWLVDQVPAWVRELFGHLFCGHRAIVPPSCQKSQLFEQPGGFHNHRSAEPLLVVAAAEVPLLFLLVSYIILSANTGSFLYFFKGQ